MNFHKKNPAGKNYLRSFNEPDDESLNPRQKAKSHKTQSLYIREDKNGPVDNDDRLEVEEQ